MTGNRTKRIRMLNTKKRENQIRVLKNHIENAIKKTTEIELSPLDNRMEKINTELIRLIGLIDQVSC